MKTYGLSEFKKTLLLFIPDHILRDPFARRRCTLAFSLILIDVACTTLIPYSTKIIVDALSLNISNTIWIAVVFLGIFWVLGKTLSHIQEIIFFPVINNTIRNLTFKVVQHVHDIPLPDYQKLSMPEILNSIRRISLSARYFIRILFLLAIPSTLKLFVAIGITLKAGLFGFTLVPTTLLAFLILYKGTQWYTQAREQAWKASDRVISRVNDSIVNTKLCRFYESFEMNTIGSLLNSEASRWKVTNDRLHIIYIALGVLLGLSITFILIFAIFGVQNQTLTVGDFVFLKGQLIAAFLPLKTFSVEFRQVTEAMIDIKKIIALLEIPKEPKTYDSDLDTTNSSIALSATNLCFQYEDRKILTDLSIELPYGEKIAIIGKSGCGKSTLLHLLSGLLQPHSGEVYLQNKPLRQHSRHTLQKKLHYISQDFKLFNLSLKENLTYGVSSPTTSKLLQLCEELDLLPLINSLPNGLDTNVGEMGTKLSGGEKQKIALIRALLIKPDILLLDETTSSISIQAEEKILRAVFSHIPTVILTSHRLSALHAMDRIYEMQDDNLFEVKPTQALNHDKLNVPTSLEA